MPMSVITVAGINPILNILGAAQQFNYTQQLSALQITNSFIPSVGIPALFDVEYRNNMLSGFRWTHATTDTDTHGSLTLQSFVNAQASGIDIMTFSEINGLSIDAELNLNNNKIINLATPTLPTDAATKAYADSVTSGLVTLISDITGSGNVGTNITTTFKQNPIFLGTNSLTIPLGTTAQQPVSPTIGMIRYNTTINNIEIYNNSIWLPMGSGDGTVTSITAGTGLNGGAITTAGTIDLANTAVAAGSYTNGNFTVNAQGQLTAASSGSGGTVTSITAGIGLDGGVITAAGTIDLANTAVVAGSYSSTNLTVNAQGQITAASSGGGSGTVTSITAGTGLSGGVITAAGTIDITNTAVTPGSYTNGDFTVNAQGQLTAASSGSGGSGGLQANLYMEGNVLTTNIINPNDIIKMNGVTTSRFLTDFTMPVDSRLLYTGTPTILTLVSVSIDLAGTGTGRIYGVIVRKNGVAVASPNYQEMGGNNIGNIVNIVPVEFATNDFIEIFVTASATSTITVHNINVSITL